MSGYGRGLHGLSPRFPLPISSPQGAGKSKIFPLFFFSSLFGRNSVLCRASPSFHKSLLSSLHEPGRLSPTAQDMLANRERASPGRTLSHRDAVPNLFGTRDWFCGRRFSTDQGWEMVSG